jgi:hypothetical protein
VIDRQQLEAILQRRFPGSSLEQIAAATNAILGVLTAGQGQSLNGNGHDLAARKEVRRAVAPRLPSDRSS